jgi:hypothetical protein
VFEVRVKVGGSDGSGLRLMGRVRASDRLGNFVFD